MVVYGYDANIVDFTRLWKTVEVSDLDDYGLKLAQDVRDRRAARIGGTREDSLGRRAMTSPIYFIGHSFGGLVIEQALVKSIIGSDASLKAVAAHTAGIMFMGTPHQGSHLTSWGSRLHWAFTKLVPGWINNTNPGLLKPLDTESKFCFNLEKTFQEMAKHGGFKHLRIYCFHESRPTGGKWVVSKKSALINAEFYAKLHGSHREMVKFSSKNDNNYFTVTAVLDTWIAARNQRDNNGDEGYGSGGQSERENMRRTNVSVQGGAASHVSVSGGNFENSAFGVAGDHYDLRSTGNKGAITSRLQHYHYQDDDFRKDLSDGDDFDDDDDDHSVY